MEYLYKFYNQIYINSKYYKLVTSEIYGGRQHPVCLLFCEEFLKLELFYKKNDSHLEK